MNIVLGYYEAKKFFQQKSVWGKNEGIIIQNINNFIARSLSFERKTGVFHNFPLNITSYCWHHPDNFIMLNIYKKLYYVCWADNWFFIFFGWKYSAQLIKSSHKLFKIVAYNIGHIFSIKFINHICFPASDVRFYIYIFIV